MFGKRRRWERRTQKSKAMLYDIRMSEQIQLGTWVYHWLTHGSQESQQRALEVALLIGAYPVPKDWELFMKAPTGSIEYAEWLLPRLPSIHEWPEIKPEDAEIATAEHE